MGLLRFIRAVAVIAALSLIVPAALGAGKTVISNRKTEKGVPKTPLDVYQKQITDAIGSRWYAYTNNKSDLLNTGTLRMNFRILANGRVTGLKVLSNTSNETFANECRQAVLESKFPPIPENVRRSTKKDFIDFENITFTLRPN